MFKIPICATAIIPFTQPNMIAYLSHKFYSLSSTANNNTKIILIGLIVAAATQLTYGQALKIVVKNVKGGDGMVLLALYNSADQFMKKEIMTLQVKPTDGEAVAEFKAVAPGVYAVSVMHDTNGNKELDSNFMGIPKEGFGFSNDAMGMFGPPDFNKASFEHTSKKDIVIKLKYM